MPKVNPAVHNGVILVKATNIIGSIQHEINLNVLDVPKLSAKLENVNINEGMDAEFNCKFISNPAPTSITWFKNETEEILPSETTIITNTEVSSVLKLVNCQFADSGKTYTVKIVNSLGEVISNKATLIVSCGPVFIQDPTDQKILKDKEAKFECVVISNPKPTITWSFNGKELTARDGVRMEKDLPKDKYTLVFPKVTPANIGSITATATNEFGSLERNCTLDVLEAPKLLNKLDNLTVSDGELASFTVKVAGKPKPTVKWFKDDVEIIIDESVEITELVENEITFTIKSCKSLENGGVYLAKIVNDFGEVVSNKATLTINRKPIFVSQPSDSIAIQDQSARFECLVDALPKAKLSWFIGDKELIAKDGFKFETNAQTNVNSLVLNKVLPVHLGKYTIKASNSVGEAEISFSVDVLGILFI
jgi:hypothetical protein